MAYVGVDAGAQEQALDDAGALFAEDPGVGCVEDAATGEADNVMQKALGAVSGAVLIVDLAVDVTEIGAVNEIAGGFVEAVIPRYEAEAGGEPIFSASGTGS